jgi:restriction endonuclease S subunit
MKVGFISEKSKLEEWEMKTLGDVLKLEYGKPLSIDKRISDGLYPMYGANGVIGRTNEFYYCKKTIIVGRKGSAGEIQLTEEKFWPLDVTYFVTFDEKKYDLMFLFNLLISLELPKMAKGVKPGINRNEVYSIVVNFPCLAEQKTLASLIEKTFAAISKAKANAEQNLKNAKELFESYLHGIFENNPNEWIVRPLSDITSKIGSGATPRGGNDSYKKDGVSFIRSMNVHDFEFRERNLAFIDDLQANELKNVTLYENDVLLNITGASIARCCIVPKKFLPARVNQHVSIIRSKKEIVNPFFLNLLLTSKSYKDQLLFTGEQGATRQALTKAQLEAFKIAFPKSLDEQETIVMKIKKIWSETKSIEAVYQQKIANLEELKKSILQKAFSGQLNTSKVSVA